MSDVNYRDTLRIQLDAVRESDRPFVKISVHVDEMLSLLDDAARLAEALGVLKTMLVADMTRDRDMWIKAWGKVPALTAGVPLPGSVPTGAGGNAKALVCCEGVEKHAPGCPADSAPAVCPDCDGTGMIEQWSGRGYEGPPVSCPRCAQPSAGQEVGS